MKLKLCLNMCFVFISAVYRKKRKQFSGQKVITFCFKATSSGGGDNYTAERKKKKKKKRKAAILDFIHLTYES